VKRRLPFLHEPRREGTKDPVAERITNAREFEHALAPGDAKVQAERCMQCGVPFCHTGCPLGNEIPDWNDRLAHGDAAGAASSLLGTNNFPEITGRICPAPCETACVAGVGGAPVAIKAVERFLGDAIVQAGLPARPAQRRTGKRVSIIGSGPAGLACAQELARAGHAVTVLERSDRLGGLLRYGIPDFKLEKAIVDARIAQLRAEGVVFRTGIHVGVDVTIGELRQHADAVVVAVGASAARELDLPGRDLVGVHRAMDYLTQHNRRVAGDAIAADVALHAAGKHVVVLGGGDTGSDCVGTAIRQGAKSVTQLEIQPRPPNDRSPSTPWPLWPLVFRTSSSQEEGATREFAVRTTRFVGDASGRVRALEIEHVDDGKVEELAAELVLLALGFTGPEEPTFRGGSLARDARGNVRADRFVTSTDGIFACGDVRRGQSLVVWAIWEGREAARAVDLFLEGETRIASSPYAHAP
jgi:glutamate synthase (NADPH/NADH) small chain